MEITDIQLGKAGEYLVCADLILKGHVAFPSEQGLSFDVVLAAGGRLYKVQVKTTRQPMSVPQRVRTSVKYVFHVRRCGKGGRGSYQKDDVDIFALVALDTRTIAYMKAADAKQTMWFLTEGGEPISVKHGARSKIKHLSDFELEGCL